MRKESGLVFVPKLQLSAISPPNLTTRLFDALRFMQGYPQGITGSESPLLHADKLEHRSEVAGGTQ
jgi:hypothetical protein